jgi:hypothetical protein
VRVAHVAPIAEFSDVFPSVLRRNVNVSTFDCSLEKRPMAFQSVHMVDVLAAICATTLLTVSLWCIPLSLFIGALNVIEP